MEFKQRVRRVGGTGQPSELGRRRAPSSSGTTGQSSIYDRVMQEGKRTRQVNEIVAETPQQDLFEMDEYFDPEYDVMCVMASPPAIWSDTFLKVHAKMTEFFADRSRNVPAVFLRPTGSSAHIGTSMDPGGASEARAILILEWQETGYGVHDENGTCVVCGRFGPHGGYV